MPSIFRPQTRDSILKEVDTMYPIPNIKSRETENRRQSSEVPQPSVVSNSFTDRPAADQAVYQFVVAIPRIAQRCPGNESRSRKLAFRSARSRVSAALRETATQPKICVLIACRVRNTTIQISRLLLRREKRVGRCAFMVPAC